MRAYISVDFEGLPHIVSYSQLLPKGKLFNEARSIVTKIIKHVCEVLHREGVKEIMVADSHGCMINIDPEQLPEYVQLIRGIPRPLSMIVGVDNCDFTMFIGYHAGAGTVRGVLDHTYSSTSIYMLKINNIIASEYLINALVAGYYDVPLILVAGDKALEEEVRKYTPWAEFVPMKRGLSRFSAISYSTNRILKDLECSILRALDRYRRGETRPLKIDEKIVMEIVFRSTEFADVAEMIPGAERIDGYTVRYSCDNIITAYRILEVVTLACLGARYLVTEC
ncbi:MAG: peptide transporter [Crenarchaeota archaeon]|nr:peptide transporter [Thermoproteota archaeon]